MIVTCSIVKGGTGKTSTSTALCQAAIASKKKALLVDLDPQGSATARIGADKEAPGAFEVLQGSAKAAEVIQKTAQGVDIIAGCRDLSTLTTYRGSARRLAEALAEIRGKYDIIAVDLAASMGELLYNAIYACDKLVIPMETDSGGIEGLIEVIETVRQIRPEDLPEMGVIMTRYDGRANINRQIRDQIAAGAPSVGAEYWGEIRAGVAIREAQALHASIFEYAPKSKPAIDYMNLYKTITRKGRK